MSNTMFESIGRQAKREEMSQERGALMRLVLWRERNRGRPITAESLSELWNRLDQAQRIALP